MPNGAPLFNFIKLELQRMNNKFGITTLRKYGRIVRKKAVQNFIVFRKVSSENIVKGGTERTPLRRACMNIAHRREGLIDSNLTFSVGEKFMNNDSEIVRKLEIDEFGDQAFVSHAVKCFPDIQENTTSKHFSVEPVNNFV
ncbi:hypothetical protein AVEN_213860-1 [Araneus ventricosus]|uniref:Uncharacterized protein n=1 Tax=Araneus ventricosus TaxID=182803 RepID=A0A4Y2II08_ARAVE|nr:hypothetical protein AVEN_213860-1 [Araneus ventricosus]